LNNLDAGVAKDAAPGDIVAGYHAAFGSFDVAAMHAGHLAALQDALRRRDYTRVLRLFNRKGLPAQIGGHFGVKGREYMGLVVRLFRTPLRERLRQALKPYVPLL